MGWRSSGRIEGHWVERNGQWVRRPVFPRRRRSRVNWPAVVFLVLYFVLVVYIAWQVLRWLA